MKKVATILIWIILSAAFAWSQPRPRAIDWRPFRFLIGQWVGESADQGQGVASFQFDLQDKILVRRNQADYAGTADRPAFSHQDLLVVYPAPVEGDAFRAIYFDNEGHVIHYAVTVSADGNQIIFQSETVAGQPRFRLTYGKTGTDEVQVVFAIAAPGKPDEFVPYQVGMTRRKK